LHSTFITSRLFSNLRPRLGIRLVPASEKVGNLGPSNCSYVCIGDYEEHKNQEVEIVLNSLFGKNKENDPEHGFFRKYALPELLERFQGEWNIFAMLLNDDSIVDLFPGTWKSIAFILQDQHRMEHNPEVYQRFRELKKYHCFNFTTKEGTDFNELSPFFDWRPSQSPQNSWYNYISEDSAFTEKIVDVFGIDNRCWHGQGYIGTAPEVSARVFLIKNLSILNSSVINLGTFSLNQRLPEIP
jgi:hypothetical protein